VIVAAHNAAGTIGRALSSLEAQTIGEGYEVIVVDDGSTDGTDEIAAAFAADKPRFRLLRQERCGPAAARNAGASISGGDALAFTDSDCFATAAWLEQGLRALAGSDLVQGAVAPDPTVVLGPWDRTLWVERETGLYETANLFVRREMFERVGGFEVWLEPTIGKPIAEDMWFGWRARRAGARSAFCREALVHHAVFPRGAIGFLDERRRHQYFPAMAAKMPELRAQFFAGRLFLSPRSAAFDAALAGACFAAATRSRWPLVAAAPYARVLLREAPVYRRRAPLVVAVRAAGDAVTLFSLIKGTIRWRSLVL